MTLGPRDARRIVPAPGLLRRLTHLGLRCLPFLPLPRGLVDERPLDGTEAVHVLDLDDRCLGDPPVGLRDVEVDVGVDPQASFLHVAVAHAEILEQEFQFVEPGAGLLRAPQVGLGDDFTQRRAGAVQVDPRVGGAGGLVVHALARVLLEVNADDVDAAGKRPFRVDHLQEPVGRERQVELADLIALRQVGVEVVFPVPLGKPGDPAVEGEGRLEGEFEGVAVHHRQRAGQAEAGRADLRVGRGAEFRGAAAEEFREGLQLHVHFQADDRREGRGGGSGGRVHRQQVVALQ